MKNIVLFLAAFLPLVLTAQSHVQTEAVGFISYHQGQVLALANKFTDAQLDWRPGEGVRSTAEVLLHIASGNYMFMSSAGFDLPEGVDPQNLESTVKGRENIIKTVTDSYTFLTSHIMMITDAQLKDKVVFPFPGEYTKLSAIILGVDHTSEHLGQLIAYARTNGVVPPWSEEGDK